MPEYKDCEALIKHLREIYCSECNNYNGVRCRACEAGDIIDMIDDAPTADVAPVIHAKWIFGKDLPEHFGSHPQNKWHLFCSQCHHQALNLTVDNDDTQDVETEFCPHCGAKMDEVNTDE